MEQLSARLNRTVNGLTIAWVLHIGPEYLPLLGSVQLEYEHILHIVVGLEALGIARRDIQIDGAGAVEGLLEGAAQGGDGRQYPLAGLHDECGALSHQVPGGISIDEAGNRSCTPRD
jgi:hypothetical protein